MKDDRLYLTHIAERIERIEKYAAPGRDHFMSDEMTQEPRMNTSPPSRG